MARIPNPLPPNLSDEDRAWVERYQQHEADVAAQRRSIDEHATEIASRSTSGSSSLPNINQHAAISLGQAQANVPAPEFNMWQRLGHKVGIGATTHEGKVTQLLSTQIADYTNKYGALPMDELSDKWANDLWHNPNPGYGIAHEIFKHRSYGPSRLADSMFDVPFHWAGAVGAGFMGGLLGRGGGKEAADWISGQKWFKNIASKEGGAWAQQGVNWLAEQGTSSIFKMAQRSGKAAWEGAETHFAAHSPFAWGASGVQLVGKGVGGTVMGAVGQVAGEAVGGLASGAAWVGATLLAGVMGAIPKWGNVLRRGASAGAKSAAKHLSMSNAEHVMQSALGAGKRVLNSVAEPIAAGEGRNMFEALAGYRLKKGVEGTVGRAIAYGAPIVGFGYGALTAKGRIEMEPLAQRQMAGVVGSTYTPRAGPNTLGATGDLTLALHALR